MALTNYPVDMPSAELMGLVTGALRGQGVPPKETAHVCWDLVGLGLGQWDTPAPGPVNPTATPVRYLDRGEAADLLESHAAVVRGGAVGAVPIPWSVIVPLLLQLAQELWQQAHG